jgi:hypothetical protein
MARAIVLMVIGAAAISAQSTRLGWPVDPAATNEVVILREFTVSTGEGFGTANAEAVRMLQQQLRGLAELAIVEKAGTSPSVRLRAGNREEIQLTASEVTANALRLLDITPALGRDFTDDDVRQPHRAALLGYGTWQSRFGGRVDVIGSRGYRHGDPGIREDVVIIGILPPGAFTRTPELDGDADVLVLTAIGFEGERVFAPLLRLQPGATAAQVQRIIDASVAGRGRQDPIARQHAFRLESLRRTR